MRGIERGTGVMSMGNPVGLHGHTEPVDDGTNPRIAMSTPVPLGTEQSRTLLEYRRRLEYVDEAWTKCQVAYAKEAIIKQLGEDAWTILEGVLAGLALAVGALVLTTAIGAIIGGGVGALGGGVGAIPGAVAGADIGLAIGNGILAWAGIGFLALYVGSHFAAISSRFRSAIDTAWNSGGDRLTIDASAREFAEGIGVLVSLVLQAIVVFLTKGAAKQGTSGSLAQLRNSLFFKKSPQLEPWLIKNFPKLRARYVPLSWTVLEEGPRIPNTSIPESMKIKVGERVFEVIRNQDKINPQTGEAIGPATKHLGERAQVTGSRPAMERAMRDSDVQLHPKDAKNWEKSEWSKAAQIDFPISSLAAALDQAEAQLIFKMPQSDAKPVGLDNWELIINTTSPVWRVFHAEYTPHPKW
jgi:hypothetical protein